MGLEILPGARLVQLSCGCNRDRMLGALKLRGIEERTDMIAVDEGAEAVCHFCNEVYRADSDQLLKLIEELKAE